MDSDWESWWIWLDLLMWDFEGGRKPWIDEEPPYRLPKARNTQLLLWNTPALRIDMDMEEGRLWERKRIEGKVAEKLCYWVLTGHRGHCGAVGMKRRSPSATLNVLRFQLKHSFLLKSKHTFWRDWCNLEILVV